MLPNHFTVEEMIYIPLTQAWFLLMKLMRGLLNFMSIMLLMS